MSFSMLVVLSLALVSTSQAAGETRNPRLFLVTTSSFSTVLSTSTQCFVTAANPTACTGRKRRRSVITDMLIDDQNPLEISRKEIESSNVVDEDLKAGIPESGEREAKLLSAS